MTRKKAWMIGGGICLAAVLWLGLRFAGALWPVLLAFALAYAFDPLVDRLEARGLSRGWGAGAVLLGLLLAAVAAVASVVPALLNDSVEFFRRFPDDATTAARRLAGLAAHYGIHVPVEQEELLARLRAYLQGLSLAALSPVVSFGRRLVSGAVGAAGAALNVLVVPVLFFFLLRDFNKIRDGFYAWIPLARRAFVEDEFGKVDRVFAGYLRGQMLVALILSAVFSAGLALLGVRFGLFIGILAGLLNVVPYLGQITGLGLALLMAVVDFDGWGRLVAIPVFFGVVNFIEGTFITPKVVGDRVGLTQAQALVALVVGGQAAGFPGLILAVPVAGSLKALLADVHRAYAASPLYGGPAAPPSSPSAPRA